MGLSRRRRTKAARGRLARLPAHGRAVVSSDLHGHVGDFERLLERSRIAQRLLDGEDAYLVVLGDVLDLERHRVLDPDVPPDGDIRILDRLIGLRRELGDRADRVVYIEGNHDFHVQRIIREIERTLEVALGDEPLPRPVVEQYVETYAARYGPYVLRSNVAPYDAVGRVCRRHLELIGGGPILAVLEGAGVALVHAGPLRMSEIGRKQHKRVLQAIDRCDRLALEGLQPAEYYASPYHQLLNNRFRTGDYGLVDLEAFCGLLGVRVLVAGHTPHSYLLENELEAFEGCRVTEHAGWIGDRQLVLCTSFGALSRASKAYLELDLARPYSGPADFAVGESIIPLYE